MSYAEGFSVTRHLTHLANLLHSVYTTNPDTVAFTSQVTDALQNFHDFLTR